MENPRTRRRQALRALLETGKRNAATRDDALDVLAAIVLDGDRPLDPDARRGDGVVVDLEDVADEPDDEQEDDQ